jgi:hypothetical protein
MIRGLSQETVDEITRLNCQAEFVIYYSPIRYLDPNVPVVTRELSSPINRLSNPTCNQRSDPFSAGGLDPRLISDVQEDISIAHRPKGKFTEI